MGDVIQLDDRRRAHEEAALWLTRVDRGLTDAERAELESWLRAEPRHAAAFLELARAWDKLEDLSALSGLVELPPARRRRRPTAMRAGAVAAVLGIVMLAVGLWVRDSRIDGDAGRATGLPAATVENDAVIGDTRPAVFSTGTGEQRRITLADGTVVSMNTRSTLSVSFSDKHRRVNLQAGEATFEVAHDAARPFIVKVAGRTIRAVGTIFTVRAKSKSSVSVIVSEGRVAVSNAPASAPSGAGSAPASSSPTRLLEAGDRLELAGSQIQFDRLSLSAMDDALAWQNGMIVFQGEPLVDALGEVSRYSDARFELADGSIGEMQVAGVFQIRDLDGFVDSLRANLGIGTKALPDGTLSLYRLGSDGRDTATE